jgi:two-component system, LytTR family, sensor kinase
LDLSLQIRPADFNCATLVSMLVHLKDVKMRRWNLIVWLLIAVFSASQTVFVMHAEGMHHAWSALYLTRLLSWAPWVALTPVVLWLGNRFPIQTASPQAYGAHLVACAAINVATAGWIALLEVLTNPLAPDSHAGPFLPLWREHAYNDMLQSLFLYAAILTVGYLVESRQRVAQQEIDAARLSELLVRAQLDALRRQIDPHFLFNAINSGVALIREQRSDAAIATLIALSEVLRRLVDTADRQETSLDDELQFLSQYVQIQKMRFADRLRIEIDVPEELLSARVPYLLLQPLVENAIKHGIAARANAGCVRIAANRFDGHLRLTIYNDGPAVGETRTGRGVGLGNVRARLKYLYGDAFGFDLCNVQTGVEVRLSLPYRSQ